MIGARIQLLRFAGDFATSQLGTTHPAVLGLTLNAVDITNPPFFLRFVFRASAPRSE